MSFPRRCRRCDHRTECGYHLTLERIFSSVIHRRSLLPL
ncbi:hypothetical protein [Duncaniella muris]